MSTNSNQRNLGNPEEEHLVIQTTHRFDYVSGLPVIRVSLNSGIDILAVVDSAAEMSMLTAEFAEASGINNWQSGEMMESIGVGGIAVHFRHNINIDIAGIKLNCPVLIVESLPFAQFGIPMILGRRGVFDSIGPVTFDEVNKRIYLSTSKTSQE